MLNLFFFFLWEQFCRDVAIYALGVGACGADAVDSKELHYVYHRKGQPFIKVVFSSWFGLQVLLYQMNLRLNYAIISI